MLTVKPGVVINEMKRISILVALLLTACIGCAVGYLAGARKASLPANHSNVVADDTAEVDLVLVQTLANVSVMQGLLATLEANDTDKAKSFVISQLQTHELTISSFLQEYPNMKHAGLAAKTLLRLRELLAEHLTEEQKQGRALVDALKNEKNHNNRMDDTSQ